MKENLSTVSALFGGGLVSMCCGVPLLLAVTGVGGGWLSEFIGGYHWYFTAAGIGLLAAGWWLFRREQRRACDAGSCMRNETLTKSLLGIATAVVLFFTAFSAYSELRPIPVAAGESVQTQGRMIQIGVQGMTCASCELHLESAVEKLPGVYAVTASTKGARVIVDYDPANCSAEQIKDAINTTGYRALEVM